MSAAERLATARAQRCSTQMMECLSAGDSAPSQTPAGRPTTRSHLLAMRREVAAAENVAIGSNPRLTLPVGSRPGAPGKDPEAARKTLPGLKVDTPSLHSTNGSMD